MRKYQQLVLLIFSFVSLILVLVYRHEYNRLHYVLEVFNFFGTPCNFSRLNTSDKYPDHFDWGQSPLWQEYGDYYVFSAFTNESLAQTLVVNKKVTKVPKKCFLWFENNNAEVGEMNSLKIAEADNLEAYIYSCRLKSFKTLPYAVSFGVRSKYVSPKKIILTYIEKRSNPITATLCVPPSSYNKRKLIEFISFHKLIGFKHFIFYYDDLPYSLLRLLSSLSEIVDVDLTFFPWNFPLPSSNLSRTIIERDCSLRTFSKSKSYIVLALSEYLIPLDSYGIYPLLQSNFHSLDQINIPVQTICIQQNRTFLPLIVQNINSYNDGSVRIIKFHFNFVNKTENIVENSPQMVIHDYKHCEGYTGRFLENKLMDTYSTDLIRSTLMQLLKDGQI
ncbi:uncharacterized protein LOC123309184 [Coccinella septempunctata]|uniref:uncharacterized protein LOC123309184 n=1 Tax=Coccinella septempunctata TaxID=41139 RepID=UPI001D069291|nr:uncharacterized protein LOC123309184 [Coccinella septempunctata]